MLKGSIINAILIIIGSLLGVFLQKGVSNKAKTTLMQAMALAVILVGLQMAIKSESIITVIISLGIGTVIGEIINIEAKLEKFGLFVENKFAKNFKGGFAKGFVTSSLVYCVGAMAIMGALQSGLENTHNTLIAKGIIDGITAIVFTSALGIGVLFSALPVFIYQSTITILAGYLNLFLNSTIILEMSATGGLLITAIGINLLGISNIKVGNMLPAIFMPILIVKLMSLF
ncbi:DUF554 domain-containing protein [Clostridium sp. 'deep sea']|uniref:DUF554 domain-containing protein n=1 Tax=Clostridium sp. 'deep sea' TaxID=2779445 RepID=UPI00189640E1|nr:DUF554 domain-containing protein [Clostridium sp. 'deep sea']QOR34094.1 DUF554 domain-containing protein [Clostridium sp. 'deep sea']